MGIVFGKHILFFLKRLLYDIIISIEHKCKISNYVALAVYFSAHWFSFQ